MEIQRKDGFISCDFLEYGDYDNSCAVERANARWIKENVENYHIERGCYGFEKAWLPDTLKNKKRINALKNYPCFDDELVSRVEMEIEEEYIKDADLYVHGTLKEILEEAELLQVDPEIYYEAKKAANMEFIVENGGNGWIDFEKLTPFYVEILKRKYPFIDVALKYLDRDSTPFPLDFYDSASDMLNHYELTGFTIDHEQAVMILRYAAELEETGK